MSTAESVSNAFSIVISPDRLQAFIEPPLQRLDKPLTEDDAIRAVESAGVAVTDAVRDRVREFVDGIAENSVTDNDSSEQPAPFAVATGQPAVEPTDAEFVWDQAYQKTLQDWQGDAAVDYYSLNSILTIEADKVIGTVSEPTPSSAGLDVLGNTIPPRRRGGKPIELGEGLARDASDPSLVRTERAGRVVQAGLKLSVQEVLSVARDVDFKSGNIDSHIDVHVGGMIRAGFSAKTDGSLVVGSEIEAAIVEAGGDITVRGGIFDKDLAHHVEAKGSITASLCDRARIRCGENLMVLRQILNCDVHAGSEVKIENGALLGGKIYARRAVRVKNIGSTAGVPTHVTVGDPPSRTPHEDESEPQLGTAAPCVEVLGTLHPGVVIRIGRREAKVAEAWKGPLRIELRKVNRVSEIVIVNDDSASVVPLPSAKVDD